MDLGELVAGRTSNPHLLVDEPEPLPCEGLLRRPWSCSAADQSEDVGAARVTAVDRARLALNQLLICYVQRFQGSVH